MQAKTVFSLNGVQRLVEVGLICCSGVAAFLLLALLSFDPADPSWSQTGYQTEIANFAGPVGAQSADILFSVFGWLSYLVPFFIGFCGFLVFRRFRTLLELDYLILGLRLLGLLLTVVTACSISSINFNDFFMYSSGGIVGDVISGWLLPNLNFVGSSLLLLCAFCIGLTLLTGISWFTVADHLGAAVMAAVEWLLALPSKFSKQGATGNNAVAVTAMAAANPAVANKRSDDSSSLDFASHLQSAHQSADQSETNAAEHTVQERAEPDFAAADFSTHAALSAAKADDDYTPSFSAIAPEMAEISWQFDEEPTSKSAQQSAKAAQQSAFNSTQSSDDTVNVTLPWSHQSTTGYTPVAETVTPPLVATPVPRFEQAQPQLQSRAFFPTTDAIVTPLPFEPLDSKTQAQAFVSVEQIADDELSFSAIDDHFDSDDLNQSFAHTQADIHRMLTDEDDDDYEVSTSASSSTSTKVVQTNSFGQPLLNAENFPNKPIDELPSLSLLDRPNKTSNPISPEDLERVSRLVELKLLDFSVDAKVVGVYPGPVVTRFELDLAPGVKVSKITGLSKDLARSLSAISVRVVEVIPGKSFIGLELPNQHREIVRLSEVIGDEIFTESKSPLTMVLGKDIAGKSVVADLAKMPHLLVAGTTGSGKSVGVNVMICSLLYKSTPEDVRFLMIDPKMLELSVYEGIPHLLTEVVTDMKEAANGLRWCVGEMERRYKLMSALGVRNLKGYNLKVADAIADGTPLRDPLWRPSDDMRTEAPLLEKLPSIVVVIDEFADMMMIVGKKVEELIARIAQKARAAGIHLILATQRPSVDVITGLIKANIPTRIAFQVSSKIDSRTILDQQGAESLLGQGDMLYLPPGSGVPNRVHGAFVDDHEVHAVVADWKSRGRPNYIPEILSGETTEENLLPGETLEDENDEADPLFDQAVSFVTESRKASVSGVQRRFRIGYNRAARLVETMEQIGIVSGPGHNGNREVLAPPPPKGF